MYSVAAAVMTQQDPAISHVNLSAQGTAIPTAKLAVRHALSRLPCTPLTAAADAVFIEGFQQAMLLRSTAAAVARSRKQVPTPEGRATMVTA